MKNSYVLLLLLVSLCSVNLNAQCQAGFSFTQSNDTLVFTDTSSAVTGTVNSWSWSFGNGTSSTMQNPSVSYGICGMYIVTLNITTDNACASSFTDTVYVSGALTAGWTYLNSPGNTNVQFAANQTAGHLEYSWDFGDGNNAAADSVTHNYTATGNYNVCLIISDTNNICTNDTSCAQITVYPPCSAGFTFTSSADTVTFTNSSAAPGDSITGYTWTFGDLNGSVAQNPVHVYSSCGVYIVQLDVNTAGGCSATATDTVVLNTPVNAFFTYTLNSSNGTAVFYGAPVGGTLTYSWNFGDGNTGAGPADTNIYANGNYLACLTVTDTAGVCAPGTFCDTIAVSLTATCNAAFTFSVSNDTVVFTDASAVTNDTIASWSWNFGDGSAANTLQNPVHVYNCGVYIATLDITTNSGCTSSFSDTITVGGQINGAYTYSITATSGNTAFNATPLDSSYTYAWDFGDSTSGSGASVNHTYANGTYTACVIITDTNNLCAADTVCNTFTVTLVPCQAAFTFTVSGTTATFTNLSSTQSGTIVNNFWNFGDFTTSAQVNPTHTYNSCGVYVVNLSIVTNTGCTNSFADTLMIPGQVNGNYTYTIDTISGNVQFFATPNNANYNFSWNFGDSTTGTGANPTHVYTNGTYTACVVISQNAGACTPDTVCQTFTVTVDTSLQCTTSWTNFANGTFQAFTPDPFNFGDTYAWDYGDGTTGTGSFATHTYTSPGTYTVCLTHTDQQGCVAQFCDTVIISGCSINFTWTGTNGNLTFTSTITGGGAFPVVAWSFGDGDTGFGTNPTHQYTSNGFFIVCAVLNPSPVPGCADTICKLVSVTGAIGIDEHEFNNSIKIAPNPANENVWIEYNAPAGSDVVIGVYDMLGNKVDDVNKTQSQPGVQKINYNTEKLSAGIYFMRFTVEGSVFTRKVVKQ